MEIKILRGCSGSGKSTYIAKHFPDAVVVSSDHYFIGEDGVYRFDPTKLGESHGACLRKYVETVIDRQDDIRQEHVLIVDNTNTQVSELAPYAAIAAAYHIPFEIITLDVDPAVAAARNTHGVPARGVERQYNRMRSETSRIPSFWKHTVIKEG